MLLPVHIVPKSSKNEVVGWVAAADGKQALKVKIAAVPEDGKANRELIRFLAKTWKLAPSAITLARGEHSRHKLLNINGIDAIPPLP
jgi:uncharacterized protein